MHCSCDRPELSPYSEDACVREKTDNRRTRALLSGWLYILLSLSKS